MMNPKPARPARDAALLVALLLTLGGCGEPDTGKNSPGAVITVKAQTTRFSRPPLPKEILPYDEALVIHEYQLIEEIECDDLSNAPDARIFLDLTQSLPPLHPLTQIRYAQLIGIDDRTRAYWDRASNRGSCGMVRIRWI